MGLSRRNFVEIVALALAGSKEARKLVVDIVKAEESQKKQEVLVIGPE